MRKPLIGVFAVQGAFIEHERMLQRLGADTIELRKAADLEQTPDGLVLPGGESTVQNKLLHELHMFAPIKRWLEAGIPTLATCAGLILLAKHISNDEKTCFGTLPVTVQRNAYGRQLGSFVAETPVKDIGEMKLTFIRAPYIEQADADVDVLAKVDDKIVGVRYRNQLALAFHPEVSNDTRLHERFLQMVKANMR